MGKAREEKGRRTSGRNHLGNAGEEIQLRQTVLFYRVDPGYGTRVAEVLGIDVAEVKKLA